MIDFPDDGFGYTVIGTMKNIADFEKKRGATVICDFVCPTEQTRNIFEADLTIWMNTIAEGRFEDTNKIFEEPTDANLVIDKFLSDEEIISLVNVIAGVHE